MRERARKIESVVVGLLAFLRFRLSNYMRASVIGLGIALATGFAPSHRRANFVQVEVTSTIPTDVRAIWRPRSGAVGTSVNDQQAPLAHPLSATPPADSLKRWRDPAARDTAVARTPTQFVIDMTSNDVVVESMSGTAIQVRARMTPPRGSMVELSGKAIILQADGRTPVLSLRR